MKELIENVKKRFRESYSKVKEWVISNGLLVGFGTGITLTRIIDGNNIIGAIAAGVVISFLIGIVIKLIK